MALTQAGARDRARRRERRLRFAGLRRDVQTALPANGGGASTDSAASIAQQQLVNDAAWQLESFDMRLPLAARPMLGRAAVLAAIADTSLEVIAAPDGAMRLRDAYDRMTTMLA